LYTYCKQKNQRLCKPIQRIVDPLELDMLYRNFPKKWLASPKWAKKNVTELRRKRITTSNIEIFLFPEINYLFPNWNSNLAAIPIPNRRLNPRNVRSVQDLNKKSEWHLFYLLAIYVYIQSILFCLKLAFTFMFSLFFFTHYINFVR